MLSPLYILKRCGNFKYPYKWKSLYGPCNIRKSALTMFCKEGYHGNWFSPNGVVYVKQVINLQNTFSSPVLAKALWKKLWDTFKIQQPILGNFLEWLSIYPRAVGDNCMTRRGKKLWYLALISPLWIERRQSIFKDKQADWSEVWAIAVFRDCWWAKKNPDLLNFSFSDLCRSWVSL